MSKLFGYARVSTEEQELAAQISALQREDIHNSDIYVEKISSRIKKRPELEKVLSIMEDGDTLIVYKLDRIGRSLKELIEIIERLNYKKCNLKTLSGSQIIDTTTAQGKLFFNIMATFSEYERDIIRERTLLGLENAKANGVKLGRKKSLTNEEIVQMISMKDSKLSVKEICNYFGISKTSYYRYLKQIDIDSKNET